MRIRATLATAATALSEDIPAYDPQAMIDSTQPIMAPETSANTDIYGAEVEGEVSIKTGRPADRRWCRRASISDQSAEAYVRQTLENFFGEGGRPADRRRSPTRPMRPACASSASSSRAA